MRAENEQNGTSDAEDDETEGHQEGGSLSQRGPRAFNTEDEADER